MPLRGALVCVCVGGLLMLAGCESIGVALGLRVRLQKLPVTSLAAALYPPGALSPGGSSDLVIVASTADGKQLTTVGAGHGKVLFDSFTFDAQLLRVSPQGVVSLPADPRVSDGHVGHLRIVAVGHPDAVAELDVAARYDVAYTAKFSGRDGRSGSDGFAGLDGSSGSTGSLDPNNPSAGGSGSNGADGGNGSDGAAGEPGQAVHVWMTVRAGAHPLLQVRLTGGAPEQFFLIDPAGGSLTIEANGGAGGRGGSGGRGGRGGSGGLGSPSGTSGMDGHSGFDGRRGADGAAGTITVSVDPQARPFINSLKLVNRSGAGRPGPAPQLQFESVPPLW